MARECVFSLLISRFSRDPTVVVVVVVVSRGIWFPKINLLFFFEL